MHYMHYNMRARLLYCFRVQILNCQKSALFAEIDLKHGKRKPKQLGNSLAGFQSCFDSSHKKRNSFYHLTNVNEGFTNSTFSDCESHLDSRHDTFAIRLLWQEAWQKVKSA